MFSVFYHALDRNFQFLFHDSSPPFIQCLDHLFRMFLARNNLNRRFTPTIGIPIWIFLTILTTHSLTLLKFDLRTRLTNHHSGCYSHKEHQNQDGPPWDSYFSHPSSASINSRFNISLAIFEIEVSSSADFIFNLFQRSVAICIVLGITQY